MVNSVDSRFRFVHSSNRAFIATGIPGVEEITGTLPLARQIRITTDLGSVEVQGNSPRITYTVAQACVWRQ